MVAKRPPPEATKVVAANRMPLLAATENGGREVWAPQDAGENWWPRGGDENTFAISSIK